MPQITRTIPIDNVCPNCGTSISPEESLCPHCGYALDPELNKTPAGILPRDPSLAANGEAPGCRFENTMFVIFQFLPSGSCLSHALDKPLVLGRHQSSRSNSDDFFDLSDFQAEHHGVSRRHCRFWRLHECLLVMDLGSTNGTYSNGKRLVPHQAYIVRHNSRLILGSLHVVITFS